jgi:hypothetical protein
MLPFLKPKKAAGVVSVVTKPTGEQEPDLTNEAMVACAEELISAIAMKDASRVAAALKDCFSMLDAQPHVEGEHE